MTASDTGELAAAADAPQIVPPAAASLFAERARRFAQLADGHALGDWLRFLGQLAQAQHEALQDLPAPILPTAQMLAKARQHAMPPLSARHWPRDALWRDVLRRLATTLAPAVPAAAQEAVAALASARRERLEALADEVLRSSLKGADVALQPFVGAALEVYWTAMAVRLGTAGIAPLDVTGLCPCCGFLPVASVVRADAGNRRYLHCALCNTEWNLVRVTCAACGVVEGIAYQQIERRADPVRAETCDTCNSYLKIVYQSQDARADPVADDLAGLALDVLVDELGYRRAGPNLLLAPGEN
ncbi:MAG: formate dehydrogenase accessory protein FdhE [Rhodocyclales bacterium]|nr:formate dehydrogenase accessory protein FdhE [Rhodocyclales bacterium]